MNNIMNNQILVVNHEGSEVFAICTEHGVMRVPGYHFLDNAILLRAASEVEIQCCLNKRRLFTKKIKFHFPVKDE